MGLFDSVSEGLRGLRLQLNAWIENARNAEEILREMFQKAGTKAQGRLPKLLPKKATGGQEALAWGFFGWTFLTIYFVMKEEYQLSNNSMLSLYFAMLCATGIAMITEKGKYK